MRWEKKGLIFTPDKKKWWQQKYGILPTLLHIPEDNIIRIFYASTDENNFGRVSYIDVSDSNPSNIVYSHGEFVLDTGEPGTFDDCGVNPSSVIRKEGKYLLYYVGYQRTYRKPYMLFCGLAESEGPDRFTRVSKSPLIERSPVNYLSNAAPFVLFDGGIYKMWFWIGNSWVGINGKDYLSASIGYGESPDGFKWEIKKNDCIAPDPVTEFSVGRPWVVKSDGLYRMFYSVRKKKALYRIGYAESKNGIDWNRKDDETGIQVSADGWDSEMICYPAVITAKGKTYLFYNGNDNGATGFGYAELLTS